MQINPAITLCTFSIKNKLYKDKEAISILTHNKNELIGSRQYGGVHIEAIESIVKMIIATGLDLTGLGR